MKDIVEPADTLDDIDRIVDAMLANPNKVGDLKTLLRQKMTSPDVVHVARAVPAERPAEDLDDFWDNVPL